MSETVEYTVLGMSCGHCKAAVERGLEGVAGVESVVVDLDTKRVAVTGTGLSDDALRSAIEDAGYEAA